MFEGNSCVADDEKNGGAASTDDRGSLDASIQDNIHRLSRFLSPKVGDADIVAEITQESYARMLTRYGPTALAEKPSLLVKIAHNLLRNLHRDNLRSNRAAGISFDELDAELADPSSSETPEAKYNTLLLKQTIFDLPPRCREVFVLHRFEGLTYPEIAEACSISRDAVKYHIAQAMRALDKHSVD